MMKKLIMIAAILLFSESIYAQATFPLTNDRIVSDLQCDLLANKLSADMLNWQNTWKKSMGKDERNNLMVQLAHESSVYKNLCMK
jgi:hypothetical protein